MIISYRPETAVDSPVALPGSKSIAARALVSAAVSGSGTRLENLPDCDDTLAMRRLISALCYGIAPDCGPNEMRAKEVSVGAAGTAFRFGAALVAATPGADITLTGTPRLSQRPVRPLTDALAIQGPRFLFPKDARSLPLRILGTRLGGGEIEIDASVSSQFISALMLVAPTAKRETTLRLSGGRTVSRPYIEMTAAVMRAFGASVRVGESEIHISPSAGAAGAPESYIVESDWSASSYFYEAALLLPEGSEIRIRQLTSPESSLQGDSRCAGIFRQLGVGTVFLPDGSAILRNHGAAVDYGASVVPTAEILNLDMEDCPDLVPAVAVAAAMLGRPFRISGIENLRVKECDRIAVIAGHLRLLGCPVSTEGDILSYAGNADSTFKIKNSTLPQIDPHDDHRMAMAFAVAAIKAGPVEILDPGCVAKSFPDFFAQLAKLGIQ